MAYNTVQVDHTPSNVLPCGKAGAAILTGVLVYLDSNGVWQKADQVSDEDGTRKDALACSWKDAQVNEQMSPVRSLILRGFSSLTIGKKQYLSDTPGEITETEPTTNTRQLVGYAVSATEINVHINPADEEVGGKVYGDQIIIAGSVASGLIFSSAIGHADGALMKAGNSGSPIAMGTVANSVGFKSYISSAAASGTSYHTQMQMYGVAASGSGNMITLRLRNTVGNTARHYGTTKGLYIEVEVGGTGVASGMVAGIDIETWTSGTAVVSGDYYGIYIKHFADVTPSGNSSVIRLEYNGSGTCDSFISSYGSCTSWLDTNCTVTNFLKISAVGKLGSSVNATGESWTHALQVSIQGLTRYIKLSSQ